MGQQSSKEEFIQKAKLIHGEKYNYDKVNYISVRSKIIIKCLIHGDFTQIPNDHINGSGCKVCSLEKRLITQTSNKEEFIQKAKLIHGEKYNYDKFIYLNSRTKGSITCLIHGIFNQSPDNHLYGRGCKVCGIERKSITQTSNKEEFIKKAKLVHGEKYNYDKFIYLNARTKGLITCLIHGDFNQRPLHHISGHGCLSCGNEIRSIAQRSSKEEFIQKAKLIHGDLYNYDKIDYKNNYSKIIIICLVHGEFLQTPKNHLNENGCLNCKRSNNEEFIRKARLIHGNKYNYDKVDYINTRSKIIITCLIHGDFKQQPRGHLENYGCSKCCHFVSKSETRWLDLLNITIRQKSIKINKKLFNVDGFDPVTNTVYEFNGDYWHGNPKLYKSNNIHPVNKKTYGELYRLTLQKEQDLRNAGYNVISIWESDFLEQEKLKKVA